jgi:hypothetical protein
MQKLLFHHEGRPVAGVDEAGQGPLAGQHRKSFRPFFVPES